MLVDRSRTGTVERGPKQHAGPGARIAQLINERLIRADHTRHTIAHAIDELGETVDHDVGTLPPG